MIIISFYNIHAFVFIINTIGTVDDLIEKISAKIATLIRLGFNYYLSEIQKNNDLINVSDIDIRYGISLTASNREEGKYPLIASNGISDYVSLYNAENAVTFGCRGTLGNVFYNKGKCFILNTAFYISDSKWYGNLYFALKHEKGLTKYQSGAAQPQITIDAIKNAKLAIPKNNNLNLVLDCISIYQNQLQKLEKIKQILLSKYF